MIEPAWLVAAVALGGVLVNAGIAYSAASRVEDLDQRLREVEQSVSALQAYNGLAPRR